MFDKTEQTERESAIYTDTKTAEVIMYIISNMGQI